MAAKIVVMDASWGDAVCISSLLREADLSEVRASAEGDLQDILIEAVRRSAGLCWSVYRGGEILMLMGTAPLNMAAGIGSPWLLGTAAADRVPKALHRIAKEKIAESRQQFPHLVNYVDVRNRRSARWLERLGFTLHPPEPYGPYGLPFHRFEMSADHVHS